MHNAPGSIVLARTAQWWMAGDAFGKPQALASGRTRRCTLSGALHSCCSSRSFALPLFVAADNQNWQCSDAGAEVALLQLHKSQGTGQARQDCVTCNQASCSTFAAAKF